MPIHNEKLEALPVMTSTYVGLVKSEEIIQATEEIFAWSDELHQTGQYPGMFHIIDTRQAETTFADMISVLKMRQPQQIEFEKWILKVIFVGTHSMVKFYTNAAAQEQFGALKPLLFREMDDALEYIRTEMSSWPQP